MARGRLAVPAGDLAPVLLQAEPEPLEIDLKRAAVIVVDMQNAFASKGGFLDLTGRLDTSKIPKVVSHIEKITDAARARGLKVIYVAHVYSPDFHEGGGPDSPNWYRGTPLTYREHPEMRDSLIVRGAWGSEIIKELKPQEGDIFMEKPRYSAFFGTDLDIVLRTYNIKFLMFVGVATNICVEASLRDAFNLDYFAILISDAAAPAGPSFTHEATISNIKFCFGWVTTSENIIKVMQ